MAESIADTVADITGGRVLLRILTNKADLRLARARAIFDAEALGGSDVVDDILHAYALAVADPYRAATHNKGIMNGISAVVLATGNDTRAVEAGAHSHAIDHVGRYTSLSHFERDKDGNLGGSLELPYACGTSACRALVTEGIQRGHMSLHASNVALAAGATPEELPEVVARLIKDRAVRQDHAERVIAELRCSDKRQPKLRAGCTVELVPYGDLRMGSKADGAAVQRIPAPMDGLGLGLDPHAPRVGRRDGVDLVTAGSGPRHVGQDQHEVGASHLYRFSAQSRI